MGMGGGSLRGDIEGRYCARESTRESVLMVSFPDGNAGGVDFTPVEKRDREEENLR